MPDDPFTSESSPDTEHARLRRVFRRVMFVQALTLVALWLLQSRFGNG